MNTNMTTQDMIKIGIPLLTFFLGTLYSIFNNKRQQKKAIRAFPQVQEAYYPIDLKEVNIKEKTKVYMNGDYAKISRKHTTILNAEIIYLEVTNLGPGHMINCNFSIKVSSTDDKKEWDFDVHVPLIKKDETILIPNVTEDMNQTEIITKRVTIKYLTHAQEEMKYDMSLTKIGEDFTQITDSLHVSRKFRQEKVFSYQGRNSLFVYLNGMKKKE
ncbi:hypothetical protein ABKP09_25940 [Peribacillus frigoritolerans]|uniref:hypothetical protein n=1 Tax=Peribacillus frigoritolerans TaxID=450367 RepID=UPI0032B4BA13